MVFCISSTDNDCVTKSWRGKLPSDTTINNMILTILYIIDCYFKRSEKGTVLEPNDLQESLTNQIQLRIEFASHYVPVSNRKKSRNPERRRRYIALIALGQLRLQLFSLQP